MDSSKIENQFLTQDFVKHALDTGKDFWMDHDIMIDLKKLQALIDHCIALAHEKPKGHLVNAYSEVADIIVEKTNCIGTTHLYLWNHSYYNLDCMPYFARVIEQICRCLNIKFSQQFVTETEQILINRFQIHDYMEMNSNPNIIPFQDVYLNWRTMQTEPPNPQYLFTYCFPFDYNPSATCPHFQHFMAEILDQPFRDRVLIYLGYCCTPSLSLQKAQIWFGGGSNGKTVLFEVFSSLFGKLVSQLPLQQFSERFQLVAIRNKLLNYHPDLPSKRLQDEGQIKSAITDKTLESDEKNAPISKWRNITKHIYGCNRVPLPPHNPTDGFFRRWEIIEFPYTFYQPADELYDPTNPHHKLKHDFEQLVFDLQSESTGIINYLMTFLPRIAELDRTNLKAIKNDWYLHSENTLQFIMDCDTSNPEAYTPAQELYLSYKKWATDKGLRNLESMKSLSLNLADVGVNHDRIKHEGEFIYIYRGIKVPEKWRIVIAPPLEVRQEKIGPFEKPKTNLTQIQAARILQIMNSHLKQWIGFQDIYEYVCGDVEASREDVQRLVQQYCQNKTLICNDRNQYYKDQA